MLHMCKCILKSEIRILSLTLMDGGVREGVKLPPIDTISLIELQD